MIPSRSGSRKIRTIVSARKAQFAIDIVQCRSAGKYPQSASWLDISLLACGSMRCRLAGRSAAFSKLYQIAEERYGLREGYLYAQLEGQISRNELSGAVSDYCASLPFVQDAANVGSPPVVSKANGMLGLARLSAKGCMTDTPESKGLVRGRLPFFISAATHSLA